MEDHALIEQCRQGDAVALRRIYDKYREHLLVLALALTGSMHEAEDVLHDVFLSFVRNLDTFRLTGKLKAYLAVCVANHARNYLKRAKYRQAVDLDQVEIKASARPGPASMAICSEQLRLISRAMVHLPMEQRCAIALHIHAGMTFRHIAKQLKLPVPTVKSRYRYGITKLRSILNQEVAS